MSFTSTPAAGSAIAIELASGTFTNIPCEGIPEFGLEASSIDATMINDTAKKFTVDTPDPGEISLTGDWDSRDAGQAALLASVKSQKNFKVTFRSGASATFAAVILSFKVSASKGSNEKYNSKLKLSGDVTYTTAA